MPDSGGYDLGEKSWVEYRRLVIAELERTNRLISELNSKIDDIRANDISQIRIEVAMLQVKAGVWGGLGGLIAGVGAVLLAIVRGH